MQPPLRILSVLIAGALAPLGVNAHESFLLWHDHRFHLHGEEVPGHEHEPHDHAHIDAKGDGKLELEGHEEQRWAIGTGVRYTRLSLEGERAHFWETGLGISYQATPWLHVGAEIGYGWFDSHEGRSSGWLIPHFFTEVHLPLSETWEVALGGEVGVVGGDEGLVGDHWELAPSVTLRYDRGRWYAEAGARFVFILGGEDHDHGEEDGSAGHPEEEAEHGHEAGEHGHDEHEGHAYAAGHAHAPGDFHDVVDPHGERELHYHVALGVRFLDERLTLEGRFHGVHVTSGHTIDRNFLRAGLRASYAINDNWSVRTEASVPVGDARRYQFQTSVSLQVSF